MARLRPCTFAPLLSGLWSTTAVGLALLLPGLSAAAAERRADSPRSASAGLASPVPVPVPVSAAEAEAWVRHAVPLPQRIEIPAKVRVPAAAIRIIGPAGDEPLARQARAELTARLPSGPGEASSAPPVFTVVLETGGPEAPALGALKNADQAYGIIPDAGAGSLRLVALTPRGLYYAAKTLQQLLTTLADGCVEIPLARVTNWPDLAKRGLWGSDSHAHLRWLADRKLNVVEQISDHGVDAHGKPYARLKEGREPMVSEGPRYGVEPVPVVLHLEQLAGRGLFQAYPQLKARGGQEGAICYAQPKFVEILADWLVALGRLPGVREVDVWLAENLHQQGGCQCDACARDDRNLLEVRAVVAAWKQAQATLPELTIFVLSSEETEKSNPRILGELPPGVKFWYYHSLFTYHASERPMVRPYLVEAAKAGRWVGVCPSLTAFVNFAHPFTGAGFIRYRLNEFVDQGLSGLIGYATPRVHYSEFNVEAAAEWAWNAGGRTPREFARSWAVRRGLNDPGKFAEWSETLGPVAWDIYGSDWPAGERRGQPPPVARRLARGQLGGLGSSRWGVYRSPWGDIQTPEQLEMDVGRADRSVGLARELGEEPFIQESLVVQGYVQSLHALHKLRGLLKSPAVADRREEARRYFRMYADGLKQAAESLPRWEALVQKPGDPGGFTAKPVDVIRGMVEQMQKVQEELGL